MEYIELRDLLNKCSIGELQLNKLITLTSRDRTKSTTITFLNHLLKYNGIKKENLFTFYFELIDVFNRNFLKLMRQNAFNLYIEQIKKEWNYEESILYNADISINENKQTIEELLENMNILCSQFKDLNDKVKTNNMNDVLVEDEMMEHIDNFLERIRELKDEITDITKILDQITQNLDKLNVEVLLDLSMKDRTLYLMFSKLNTDNKLPPYINIMFLNYVYIINLIKKHLIYYRRIISKVTGISDNMEKYVEESKETVQSKDNLFNLNRQQKEIDGYLEGLQEKISKEDISEEDILEEENKDLEEENKDLDEENKDLEEENKDLDEENKYLDEENKYLDEENKDLDEYSELY